MNARRLAPGLRPEPPHAPIGHELGPVVDHLAAIRRRRQLLRDPVYLARRAEIERVLGGFGWRVRERAPGEGVLRAVSWNVERGKRFDGVVAVLRDHPELRGADLILLNEVDVGMGRSGNRDVAAEIAAALDLDYAYANGELVLSPGDAFERDHGRPNGLSLHGTALLTRLPITRLHGVALPEPLDKFHDPEKRLGGKRALLVEVQTVSGPLTVAIPHLDPFAGPRHRARQIGLVLDGVRAMGNARVLLGGDLNTNTYDFSGAAALAWNVAYKLARLGFDETVRHYLTPDRLFERATFQALAAAGLQIEGFNQPGAGTTWYDLNDPEILDWTRRYLPGPIRRYLQRRLAPWGGCVPLKIDWMAGRGLSPLGCAAVERPAFGGEIVSDHDPIRVDFRL